MNNNDSDCLPRRVILAFLCATGVMELYMSRTNLSIAIVAMVQTVISEAADTDPPRDPFCLRHERGSIDASDRNLHNFSFSNESITRQVSPYQDTFRLKLTSTQRGLILSSFFYSYGLTGIIGGRFAEKYGTKKVFGAAVFVDAISNFLIPLATKTNYIMLIIIRLVTGLFQGACYPALHSLVSVWIPQNERSRFIAFTYIANSFGTIFTLTACGVIISELGWEAVFYICGSISLVWLVFWMAFMYDKPEKHPKISVKEKNYILSSLRTQISNKPVKTPWKNLFLSVPLWAVNINHAGNMFGLGFVVTQLPIYMSSIIGVNIRENGVLSSLPFLARFLGSTGFSWLSNFLIKKTNWKQKTWKRIITVIGNGICGLAILLVGYVGCNVYTALSLFVISLGMNGANSSGYLCNHLDLIPNFAGTGMGISNTVAFLYTTLAPIIVGAMTPEETLSEWISVFWVVCVSYFVTGIFYNIFVSCDIQPWNNGNVQDLEVDCDEYENMLNMNKFENSKKLGRIKVKDDKLNNVL